MDEYFCPKCGAKLNDQYDFNPNGGTWRCTECGELLMDDDVYDGDSFEGVAWYCDSCGALLNRQYGFSDSYGSWTCTECGHTNGITEDDIISDNQPEFRCPNCGAGLDDQWCFADDQNDWKCTECGAHLHHDYSDDKYTVIKHICPRCDAPLDIQWCFDEYDDDWQCTECGAHLHHDYSDDEYEEVESDDDDDEETDSNSSEYSSSSYSSKGTSSSRGYRSNSTEYSGPSQSSYTSLHTPTKRKVNWKLRIFGTLALIIAILAGGVYYEIKMLTPVGTASSALIGKEYEPVITILEDAGFTNISTNEISDLPLNKISEENKVVSIKIGLFEEFSDDSMIPSNFPVVITYHTLEKISLPLSSKDAKGANYQDVMKSFKDAGFENIALEVEYDIITGWMTDDGEVKSVTVNGDKKFSAGSEYRADAEVIITYHTYRKNKPK